MLLLQSEHILPALEAVDKDQVFADIALAAARSTGLDSEMILNALQEREKLGCTGVGQGFSLPHARFESLGQTFGLFARLSPAIDFGARDGQKVDLLFMLLSPSNNDAEHLKSLALIARMFRDEAARSSLRQAKDRTELYQLLNNALHDDGVA